MVLLLISVVIVALVEFILIRHILKQKNIKQKAASLNFPLKSIEVPQKPLGSELEKKIWFEEEMPFLFDMSEKIFLTRNKELIAKEVVEGTCNFLNAQVGAFFLIDKKDEALRIKFGQGIDQEVANNLTLKKEESISGLAWANNELLTSDLTNDSWFKRVNKERYLSGQFVSVPVSLKKEPLGVLSISGRRNNSPFSQDEIAFLIHVSRISAIVLQNLELFSEVEKSYLDAMTTLAISLDERDSYTRKHSENVTNYSVAIAKEMNLSFGEIEIIRHAGLLHDIGKIGIRDEVLLKPGKLTPEEFEQIKSHPLKGEAIVKPLSFLKNATGLIRHHHERYDGKGYPDGLKSYDIELGARVMAVSDTFDAMTTDRPYRKALKLEEAVAELKRCSGTQFDPEIVGIFLKILDSNPGILNSG